MSNTFDICGSEPFHAEPVWSGVQRCTASSIRNMWYVSTQETTSERNYGSRGEAVQVDTASSIFHFLAPVLILWLI